MNEDFYIEAEQSWKEYLYFEPDYNPEEYMEYDDEQDGEWVDD